MKFGWILISVPMLLLSMGSGANVQIKPVPTKASRMRNQRSIYALECIGLHCSVGSSRDFVAGKVNASTMVQPRRTVPRKESAKERQASKKDEQISVIGTFLKLLTRGFLKKIALPAIVRLSMPEDSKMARRAKKLVKITRAQ